MPTIQSCKIIFYCDRCGVFVGHGEGVRTNRNTYCLKHGHPKPEKVQRTSGIALNRNSPILPDGASFPKFSHGLPEEPNHCGRG